MVKSLQGIDKQHMSISIQYVLQLTALVLHIYDKDSLLENSLVVANLIIQHAQVLIGPFRFGTGIVFRETGTRT